MLARLVERQAPATPLVSPPSKCAQACLRCEAAARLDVFPPAHPHGGGGGISAPSIMFMSEGLSGEASQRSRTSFGPSARPARHSGVVSSSGTSTAVCVRGTGQHAERASGRTGERGRRWPRSEGATLVVPLPPILVQAGMRDGEGKDRAAIYADRAPQRAADWLSARERLWTGSCCTCFLPSFFPFLRIRRTGAAMLPGDDGLVRQRRPASRLRGAPQRTRQARGRSTDGKHLLRFSLSLSLLRSALG